MPILIVLGLLAGCGAVSFVQSCRKPEPPRNKTQSDYIADQMIGTSKAECRRILRKRR